MKKLLTLFFAVITIVAIGQEKTCCESKKTESVFSYYGSVGLSVRNSPDSEFKLNSYPSVELGGMYKNLSIGIVGGHSDLTFKSSYWYELKFAAYQEVGFVDVYAIFGIGDYTDAQSTFIEYGVGVSYVPNKFGFFAQASNWDGYWYLTPGLVYNF